MMFRGILVHRALRRCEVEELPRLESELRADALLAYDNKVNPGPEVPLLLRTMLEQFPRDAREFGAGIFLAAMISLAGTGHPCLKHFPAWRNAAQNLTDGQGLSAWLDEVRQRLAGTLDESERILATRGVCWEGKITAALHLATSANAAPSQLLGAHAILFEDIVHSPWKRDIEHGFYAFVEHGWRQAARNCWWFRYPQQVPGVLADSNTSAPTTRAIAVTRCAACLEFLDQAGLLGLGHEPGVVWMNVWASGRLSSMLSDPRSARPVDRRRRHPRLLRRCRTGAGCGPARTGSGSGGVTVVGRLSGEPRLGTPLNRIPCFSGWTPVISVVWFGHVTDGFETRIPSTVDAGVRATPVSLGDRNLGVVPQTRR